MIKEGQPNLSEKQTRAVCGSIRKITTNAIAVSVEGEPPWVQENSRLDVLVVVEDDMTFNDRERIFEKFEKISHGHEVNIGVRQLTVNRAKEMYGGVALKIQAQPDIEYEVSNWTRGSIVVLKGNLVIKDIIRHAYNNPLVVEPGSFEPHEHRGFDGNPSTTPQ